MNGTRYVGAIAAAIITWGGTAAAQGRQFWVLDASSPALLMTAPGDLTVGAISLQGNPRAVRGTAGGDAVVADAGGPILHLVSGGGLTAVLVPAGIVDAAPDGQGGAWVGVRLGQNSELLHIDAQGQTVTVATFVGTVTRVLPVRGGRVVVSVHLTTSAAIVLFDGNGGWIDAELLPDDPSGLVLDNHGRLLVSGSVPGVLAVLVADGGGIRLAWTLNTAVPLIGVAPFGGSDALLIADGWPPVLRVAAPDGTFGAPFPVAEVGALECLPDGGVLAHEPTLQRAWRFSASHGATWMGAWPATWAGADGPGLQDARARPDDDADGDGFTNGEEIAVGTDPGFALSAPLAFWRSGEALHLDSIGWPTYYAVVASEGVIAGSSPLACAPGPLLYVSLTAGQVFDLPWGTMPTGYKEITVLSGLAGDPWVACAVFGPSFEILHARGARRLSQW